MDRKSYLKKYKFVLTTLSPVFIGCEKEINKKEYSYNKDKSEIDIYKPYELYQMVKEKGLADDFENFICSPANLKKDLGIWLSRQKKIKPSEVSKCVRYSLEIKDAKLNDAKTKNSGGKSTISEFVKDSYGLPYIPGSSLKGALRTIIMAERIYKNKDNYRKIKEDIEKESYKFKGRKTYISKPTKDMEIKIYNENRLRDETKIRDARNDELRGLIISDSKSLELENLILCQRYDYSVGGKEKQLPLLRECLKPDIKIEFEVTIDEKECSVTKEEIISAVEIFNRIYNEKFVSSYIEKNSFIDMKSGSYLYIGGGVGFASKTEIFILFEKNKAAAVTQRILSNTSKKDKHNDDVRNHGISPRTIKCTKYHGKTYQMGLCKLEIL